MSASRINYAPGGVAAGSVNNVTINTCTHGTCSALPSRGPALNGTCVAHPHKKDTTPVYSAPGGVVADKINGFSITDGVLTFDKK